MEMRMIALLLLAAQASIPVEVGRFDPANFPHAKLIDRRMPEAELVQRVDTIIAAKQCTLPGQTKDRYDIVVPYAVMVGANETESRIVVKDMSCPPIETLVGEVANALVKAGDFRKNPFGGGFSVACGLSDAIDFLNPLAFTDDEIAYLGTLTGGDVRLYLNANHPISRLNSPVHLSSSSEGRHA